VTDDELLAHLSVVFAPPALEPPAAALRALHVAIDARIQAPKVQAPKVRAPGVRRSARRRWAIPALAGAMVFGGSGVAFAASPTVNRAARQLAHTAGLPVDSPLLDDARHHRDQLRAALRTGDPTAIAAARAELRDDLEHLDTDERNQIQHDADQLLRQADQLDQRGAQADHQADQPGQRADQPAQTADQPDGDLQGGGTTHPAASTSGGPDGHSSHDPPEVPANGVSDQSGASASAPSHDDGSPLSGGDS
jgi:hypothetical protein